MTTKRLIITLENQEGNNAEVIMIVPNDIADEFNEAPMFRSILEDMFEVAGFGVVNVEMAEEMRHEMKREVWTEGQRRAYRENLKKPS